jgi:mannan endo-1,4-beta-mannosidase
LITWSGIGQELLDKNATAETRALYSNMLKLSETGIMFGHQDGDAYGVGWFAEDGKSDVKEVTGSHPAVHGWDIGRIEIKSSRNLDSVDFKDMLKWIKATYQRGGITTISWHINNPVTKKDSWDKTPAVHEILPGKSLHGYYVAQLDLVADFLKQCKSGKTYIPVIFRPWHEHNGDWFWWGKGNASEEDYIALWRFTVDYLKNKRKLHHIIYAFSPDASRLDAKNLKQSYLYGYPGDQYVDILGLDNYRDVGIKWNTKSAAEQRQDFIRGLQAVSDHAKEKKKVAALTETGLESVTNPNWFTEVILMPLKATPSINIAYVLVWRNDNPTHHYAPYPGHPSAPDFVKFYKDPFTIFESDLQNVYQTNKPPLK